jgi:hypothetical protein
MMLLLKGLAEIAWGLTEIVIGLVALAAWGMLFFMAIRALGSGVQRHAVCHMVRHQSVSA